ncbi:MAG: helix-turn-helix domain-containing protein [Candidatus Rifleibacteriota bacterium]
MKLSCLTEEELLELYYQESDCEKAKIHVADCSTCQERFYSLCRDLIDFEVLVPDLGFTAVNEAMNVIEQSMETSEFQEILTPEEVADWFKVDTHNILNIYEQLPHFIVDGQIRFERKALEKFLNSQSSRADQQAPDQLQFKLISIAGRKAG